MSPSLFVRKNEFSSSKLGERVLLKIILIAYVELVSYREEEITNEPSNVLRF